MSRSCDTAARDLAATADRAITAGMQAAEPLLQFFAGAHLPPHLSEIALPFALLAEALVRELPRNPERTTALRKLLESKDCAVRARLWAEPESMGRRTAP